MENSSSRPVVLPWLIAIAAVIVAVIMFMRARPLAEHMAEPPFKQADLDTAQGIINDGFKSEKRKEFSQAYVRLPGSQRFELLKQLAGGINTGKIVVDRAGPLF